MVVPVKLRSIPLWDRWGSEQLKAKFHAGERAYRRGFRLEAFSDEEITFPNFKNCYSHGITLGEIQRSDWPKFTGVDLAGKKRPGNAIVTVAVNPKTKRRYPCDIRFGAWKSPETCAHLAEINRMYNPTVIMVEDNAYQEALIDWVQATKSDNDFWMKLEPTTTTGGKKISGDIGLPSLEVEFKNRAWVVPADEFEHLPPGNTNPWYRWAYEFNNHPLASQSDGVMATWFVRQGIEIYGNFGTMEEIGDLAVR